MKHLICMVLCCIALLPAAVPSFADDPIVIEFVTQTPVSGCACQAVEVTVRARDCDSTTSEAGYDDLVFHALPYGSGWTPAAAPWRDGDGWWYQTFRKTFGAPGEYPSAEGEYIFRALDLDIFHGENDPDNQVVRTKVIIQDHYEKGTDISCTIDAPANGDGYAPNAIVSCSVTASDVDKKNCQDIGDTVTYLWSATGGQFSGSTTNSTATWIAPPGAGTYTISVRVDDADDPVNPPYCGLRSDNAVTKTVDVTVGIIHVSKSGNNTDGLTWGTAKTTVQGGLNAASAGGEVWVKADTYQESATILLPAGVGLYGGFDGTENVRIDRKPSEHETILDGGLLASPNPQSVVRIAELSGRDTIIDGFTIQHGSGTHTENQWRGAGILSRFAAPTITNNRITNNTSTWTLYGGGIWLYNSPSPGALIANNVFSLNGSTNTYGGAIGIVGGSGTTITGNVMESNTANNGGGILCGNGTVNMSHNTIRNNIASGQGGGVFLQGTSGSISGNLISENSGYMGGGVYALSATGITFSNNVIWQNGISSTSGGAGIHLDGSSANLVNNTIVDNTGDGIYFTNTSNPTIANNIVAFNSKYGLFKQSGTPTLSHNCVFGNTSGPYYSLTPDAGSIALDPKLASDWKHIQPDSPCINTGDDTRVQTGWLDLDGQAVQGTHVDIGADESDGSGWYYLTLSVNPDHGVPGGTVTVTAHLSTWDGQPVSGITVHFAVSAGAITAINGIAQPPGTTNGDGDTDTGNAAISMTKDSVGLVTVSTVVNEPGTGDITKTIDVVFKCKVGFLYDLCLADAQVRERVDQFLTNISVQYPWVDYQWITGTPFAIGPTFNTVFLVMPTRNLEPSESASLLAFVQSGRNKRIVLVGDFNPGWSLFNTRLNVIAGALDLHSQFSISGDHYDPGRFCTPLGHYLTDGVAALGDRDTSPFQYGWQGYARPLVYINDLLPGSFPWILEEDTLSIRSYRTGHAPQSFSPAESLPGCHAPMPMSLPPIMVCHHLQCLHAAYNLPSASWSLSSRSLCLHHMPSEAPLWTRYSSGPVAALSVLAPAPAAVHLSWADRACAWAQAAYQALLQASPELQSQ